MTRARNAIDVREQDLVASSELLLSILSAIVECTCSLQPTRSAQCFQSELVENFSLLPIPGQYSPL